MCPKINSGKTKKQITSNIELSTTEKDVKTSSKVEVGEVGVFDNWLKDWLKDWLENQLKDSLKDRLEDRQVERPWTKDLNPPQNEDKTKNLVMNPKLRSEG